MSSVQREKEPTEEDNSAKQPQVQITNDEEGVICISRNKNMIKKRSFVEV